MRIGDNHTQGTQALRVVVRLADISNNQLSTGFEDAHSFIQGLIAVLATRNIMDGNAGENEVKTSYPRKAVGAYRQYAKSG